MTDVTVGIKDKLVAAGVGAFPPASQVDGWVIFVGKLPSSPDTAVGVLATGGREANPKWLLDYPSVQVVIRGAPNTYVATRAKAQLVKDTLLGLPSQTVNGDQWVSVTGIGDITTLGEDQTSRPMFTVNFQLIVEPATGTNRTAL